MATGSNIPSLAIEYPLTGSGRNPGDGIDRLAAAQFISEAWIGPT